MKTAESKRGLVCDDVGSPCPPEESPSGAWEVNIALHVAVLALVARGAESQFVESQAVASTYLRPQRVPFLLFSSSPSFSFFPIATQDVYSTQADMGPGTSQGCEGWLAPVLCAGHGIAHEAEV